TSWIGRFASSAWNWVTSMARSVASGAAGLWNSFTNMVSHAWGVVESWAGRFFSVGKDIVMGIIHGVENMASTLWNTVSNMVSNAYHSVLSFFGISSPSKLMRDMVGRNIVLGMIEGI